MTTPGFIEAALSAIGDALQAAADKAGLTLNHYPITRTAARRFRSRVRQLEAMLRRLLVLMAASLTPEPARAANGTPCAHSQPPSPAASTPARQACKPSRPRAFPLSRAACFDPERLAALRASYGHRPPDSRDTATGPLLHRYRTLLALLSDPLPAARRMARHLARLRAAGEPRPLCLPDADTHRLGPDAGAIAAALPGLVTDALSGWYDSG